MPIYSLLKNQSIKQRNQSFLFLLVTIAYFLFYAKATLGVAQRNIALLCWVHNCPVAQADILLQSARNWQPANNRNIYWQARLWLEQEKPKEAIHLLERIPSTDYNAEVVFALANGYDQLREFPSAYQSYLWLAEHVTYTSPQWGEFLRRGDRALATAQWLDAKVAFRKALTYYPANLPLAKALYRQLLEARLQEQLAADDTSLAGNFVEAYLCWKLGDLICAQSVADSIITNEQFQIELSSGQRAMLYTMLGEYDETQQRWESALANYQQAVDASLYFNISFQRLNQLYRRLGDMKKAGEVHEYVAQLAPSIPVKSTAIGKWQLVGINLADTVDIAEGGVVTVDLYWTASSNDGTVSRIVETRHLRNLITNAGFNWAESSSDSQFPFGYRGGTQLASAERVKVGPYPPLITGEWATEGDREQVLVLDNQDSTATDLFSWPIGVKPTTAYLVAGRLHVDDKGMGAAYLGIHWSGDVNSQPTLDNWIIPGAKSRTWATVAGVLIAPTGTLSASLWLMNSAQPKGKVYFDDLVMVELKPLKE